MKREFSLYLDALRLLAAFMVLLVHWQNPLMTGSDHKWMMDHDIGGDGVVLFFVLSGLLIAYTAEKRRDEGAVFFAVDRLSRLWSVGLPALFCCALLDSVGHAAHPDFYAEAGFEGEVPLLHLLSSVIFANEIWFSSIEIGTNGPYWSLGYEAWYYMIFAGFFYAPKRWRWWIAGGLAIVVGPKVWLLAPSWLFGVLCWRAIASGKLTTLSRATAWILTCAPVILYFFLHKTLFHRRLIEFTIELLGPDVIELLSFSDTFMWAFVLGILVSLHILGVSALLQRSPERAAPYFFEAGLRWLAGGTFALYLVHYPVLFFASAMLPGDVEMPLRQAGLLLITCVIAYSFAELTERRGGKFRSWLRHLVHKLSRRIVNVPAT